MAWLSNLFKKKKTERAWLITDNIAAGLSYPSGYTPLNKCPEVITAVNKIADLVSNMTIHLMENGEYGDVRVENELSKKIDIYPCKNMSRKSWLFFIVRTLLLEGDGNAVVLPKYRTDNGIVLIDDLLPVPASSVSIIPGATFQDDYRIQIDDRLYDPEQLIHFKINPDPNCLWRGQGFRLTIAQIVKTLDSAEKVKNEFMSGRYMPSLIVKLAIDSAELNDPETKKKLLDNYRVSDDVNTPWMVPETIADVQTVTPLSLEDIGVTDAIAQNKETIAALLGVPAFLLGVGEFNVDEYNTFIRDKILSVAKEIEQTLTAKLLTKPEWYFRFNIRSLYAYDMETLSNVGGQMFDRGIMSANEVRDWLNLSPVEGLDIHVALENYIPVELLGQQKKLESALSDIDENDEEV